MMRSLNQLLLGLLLLVGAFLISPRPQQKFDLQSEANEQEARMEWERIRLCDPRTGKIPANMRTKELLFASTLPTFESMYSMKNSIQSNTWDAIGPRNIGGRTRAIGIDVANEKTLLAGSVSNGVWKSDDGGASWRRTTGPSMMMSVTCLTQDTRVGKTNIWYAGTGEFWGNSAQLNGTGIYKSTDNGESWTSLKSTYNNTPESWDSGFEFIWRIVVDHTNKIQDVLYSATTLGSIQRSSDGGQTWTVVLGAFANGYGYFTELAISPSGVVYATMSQQTTKGQSSPVRGIFRSVDGIKWVNISPSFLPTEFGRIAIGISPSDETNVYFLGNTVGSGFKQIDFGGREDWTSLWKYSYAGGDGSGSGGLWENRSENLPNLGGTFGDFTSQGGYDLFVKVHPTKPNVVFVGGANLNRSEDGFTSKNWSWCGGYGPGTTLPFYELYPNNHPDQHDLIFYPSNPDKVLDVCDGGIFRSDDIRAGTVKWTSLNNGYTTTQFYTCTLDHRTKSSVILGGLQDNGTVYTNTLSSTADWSSPGRGDGSYCAIANDGNVYMSSQQGVVARFQLDSATGSVKQYARIDPFGTVRDSFAFINPFVLDPNNNKQLYMPYRHQIFKCNDATLPTWGSWEKNGSTVKCWDTLQIPSSSKVVSTVAISTSPARRLYYGTEDGYLYRIEDVGATTHARRDITGSTFPRGNIECICVNPHDADSVLVVFSNYNVQSLFFTSNGGTTWQPVGGNLEASVNGVGNGPSCRWAKFAWVNGKPLFFVGTSVGLFFTASLNGTNTVWVQEGTSSIGSNVVSMMDYRETDNLMIVSTHGGGMFAGIVRDMPPAPEVPVLDSPADGVRGVLKTLYLSWKSAANASGYDIQVSKDPSFINVNLNGQGTSLQYNAIDLDQGRVPYYWRVRSFGAGGLSAYSSARVFTTAIAPPELMLPVAAATSQPLSVQLVWSKVVGAKHSHVQVSTSLTFASSILDSTLNDTSVVVSGLLASKRYYWRVLSSDDDGDGVYSVNRNFQTAAASDVTDLQTPENVHVFPQPASDLVSVQFTLEKPSMVWGDIYDVRGRHLYQAFAEHRSEGPQSIRWSCAGLANGDYILQIRTHTSTLSKPIRVRH